MKKVRVLDYSITVPGLPDWAGAYGAKGIEFIVKDETELAGLIEDIEEIDHPDTFEEIHIDDIDYEVIDEDYQTSLDEEENK